MVESEKSAQTISKYKTELTRLYGYLNDNHDCKLNKQTLLDYKESLKSGGSASSSVNAAISAINNLTRYLDQPDLRLKLIKSQQAFFRRDCKNLTLDDYTLLVRTARRLGRDRTELVLETLGSTGIRVSELSYITCDAVNIGEVDIDLKGKRRMILLPSKLRGKMQNYMAVHAIDAGPVFLTRTGGELSRQQVWREMKALCGHCDIPDSKVYPHNFRHMFALVFYERTHDIVALSNMLGHSSIETTRIYLTQSDSESVKTLDELGLCL